MLLAALISMGGCSWDNRPVRPADASGDSGDINGEGIALGDPASSSPARNPDIPEGTPSFRFGNIDYVLINRSDVVNQYIPFGQTLTDWTSMFALRKFPGMSDPEDAVANVTDTLKIEHPETEFEVTRDRTTGDRGIDFVIWTEDKQLTEFDVHIYQKQDFGVMGKMFMMRGYDQQGHRELIQNIADNRKALTKSVFGFNFPVFIQPN